MTRLQRWLESDAVGARLSRGGAGALMVYVIGAGLALGSQLVLARVLGAEQYGLYAYVFAWVGVLTLISTLGFRTSLLRFVAAYRTREQWVLLRSIVRYAERRVALAGIASALIGAAVVWSMAGRLPPTLRDTFLVGFAVVPVYALLHVRGSTVRGLGRVVTALAPDKVIREGMLVLLVGGMALASTTLTAPSAMAALLAATVVALVAVSFVQRRARLPSWAPVAPSFERTAEWRNTSLFLLAFSGGVFALGSITTLMIGVLLDTTSAGVYFLAVRLADLVQFPLITINAFFGPIIAGYHSADDHASLQRAVTLAVRASFLAGLAIAAGLLLLSSEILRLLGSEFVEARPILAILLIGQLVNACTGPAGLLLSMTGEERNATVIAWLLLPLTALALWIVVPLFGLTGAAVVRAIAVSALNITYVIIGLRRIGIAALPFPLPLLPRPSRG